MAGEDPQAQAQEDPRAQDRAFNKTEMHQDLKMEELNVMRDHPVNLLLGFIRGSGHKVGLIPPTLDLIKNLASKAFGPQIILKIQKKLWGRRQNLIFKRPQKMENFCI